MKHFKTALALLLAVLWLPVTSHCTLESAGLIAGDDCCASADSPCGKGAVCGDDCKNLESASYKSDSAPKLRLAPEMVAVPASLPEPLLRARVAHAPSPPRADTPDFLAASWQFSLRAAHAPRAPSVFA